MKIHKATDTNVTVCGISTPGKVMAISWYDVDCVRCLKAGGRYQADAQQPNHNIEQQELRLETGGNTK